MKKEYSIYALFLTAAIWGFAFVAQRKGMEILDPFLFNSLRFFIGFAFVSFIMKRGSKTGKKIPPSLGLILFAGATLQQIGIAGTTAGNAGFITGLYIVFVPILGLFRRQRVPLILCLALFLAVIGLYLINDNSDIEATISNGLVLIGAIFWAIHMQLVDKLVKKHNVLELAFSQYLICALLSLLTGIAYNLFKDPTLFTGTILLNRIGSAWVPLLYSGLISVGVAYSLQVFAQRNVEPTKAAIVLSLESLFALVGGWWLLKEQLSLAGLIGAALLLNAMIISIFSGPSQMKNVG